MADLGDLIDEINEEIDAIDDVLDTKSARLPTTDPDYNTVSTGLATTKQKSIDAQATFALSGITGAPILTPNPPGPETFSWTDQLDLWAAEAKDLFDNKGPGDFKKGIADRMASIEQHESDARSQALD
ncbi:MAG: hypothetical protein AAF432_00520 [Planctomycetota bacterium]